MVRRQRRAAEAPRRRRDGGRARRGADAGVDRRCGRRSARGVSDWARTGDVRARRRRAGCASTCRAEPLRRRVRPRAPAPRAGQPARQRASPCQRRARRDPAAGRARRQRRGAVSVCSDGAADRARRRALPVRALLLDAQPRHAASACIFAASCASATAPASTTAAPGRRAAPQRVRRRPAAASAPALQRAPSRRRRPPAPIRLEPKHPSLTPPATQPAGRRRRARPAHALRADAAARGLRRRERRHGRGGAGRCWRERSLQAVITDMRLPDGTGLDLLRRHGRAGPAREGHRHHRLRLGRERGRGAEGRRLRLPDQAGRPAQFRAVVASALGRRRRRAPSPSARLRRRATAARRAPRAAAAGARRRRPPRGTAHWSAWPASRRRCSRCASLVDKVARSMAPVLVQGESGTGKELVARAIHDVSRARGAALRRGELRRDPRAPARSEFFGYRKGAFTGAAEDREGFFQAAQGGTLFLDEIGDLPLAMQSKLLRVIQERAVRPVGAVAEMPVNVRIAQRHAQGPGRRGAGRPLPPGPVLPAQRDPDPRAAAARAARRPAGDLRRACSSASRAMPASRRRRG